MALLRSATVITALTIFAAGVAPAAAQERPPRFADYPVKDMYQGRTARPIFPTRYLRDHKEAFPDRADKPNFAGRLHVVKLSCGASCVTGVIMDAPTGRIIEQLFTICCWQEIYDDFEPINFKPESRLIAFLGARNEKPGDLGYHYYVWERGKLRYLRTIKRKGDFLKPPEEAEPSP